MPGLPADIPPKQLPWSTQPTPELLDGLIVAVYDSENVPREYRLLSPGEPHPNPKEWPGYYFCKAVVGSYNRTQFWFSLGSYQNQDLYNYDLDFVADSADHPIFVRRYLTRRDTQASGAANVARAAPFTGIYSIYVTDGGSGYDPENPPTVTVAGNATAVALVTKAGVVQWIRITSEGSGYVAAPGVVIAAPSAGVTATATAVIQDPSTVLIKQRFQQLPTEDPRYPLFLLETRIYQTFEGPLLTEWSFVPRIYRLAKITKQLILDADVPTQEYHASLVPGQVIEYQPLTDVYSARIITTLPTTGLVWSEEEGDANDVVYQGFINYRFPDQILEDPNIYVILTSNDNGIYSMDFAWDCKVEEGYHGPCRAEVRERFTYDPEDAAYIAALPTPTLIIPKAQTVFSGIWKQGGDQAIARFYTVQIPLSLHPQLDVDFIVNGIVIPPGMTSVRTTTITATTPPSFSTGDSIYLIEQPERLGIAGLWMTRIIEIFHP